MVEPPPPERGEGCVEGCMAADAVFESIIAQRDGESLLGDEGEAGGFL